MVAERWYVTQLCSLVWPRSLLKAKLFFVKMGNKLTKYHYRMSQPYIYLDLILCGQCATPKDEQYFMYYTSPIQYPLAWHITQTVPISGHAY